MRSLSPNSRPHTLRISPLSLCCVCSCLLFNRRHSASFGRWRCSTSPLPSPSLAADANPPNYYTPHPTSRDNRAAPRCPTSPHPYCSSATAPPPPPPPTPTLRMRARSTRADALGCRPDARVEADERTIPVALRARLRPPRRPPLPTSPQPPPPPPPLARRRQIRARQQRGSIIWAPLRPLRLRRRHLHQPSQSRACLPPQSVDSVRRRLPPPTHQQQRPRPRSPKYPSSATAAEEEEGSPLARASHQRLYQSDRPPRLPRISSARFLRAVCLWRCALYGNYCGRAGGFFHSFCSRRSGFGGFALPTKPVSSGGDSNTFGGFAPLCRAAPLPRQASRVSHLSLIIIRSPQPPRRAREHQGQAALLLHAEQGPEGHPRRVEASAPITSPIIYSFAKGEGGGGGGGKRVHGRRWRRRVFWRCGRCAAGKAAGLCWWRLRRPPPPPQHPRLL